MAQEWQAALQVLAELRGRRLEPNMILGWSYEAGFILLLYRGLGFRV